ncbi:MAG: glycosyltransferase [Desulfovibrio sp.]|nr:glycosyltransferase [Desulfovibrio sp.]
MHKIFWIGNPFFVNALRQCGWTNVVHHSFEGLKLFTFDDIVRIAGFIPDCVVVADKSVPPFVLGVERFPCLTALYVVDSHLQSWYPFYAQAFDICLVSLKDHLPLFAQGRLASDRVFWFPPFAMDEYRPQKPAAEEWECIFVGRVNDTTPRRRIFLDRLKEKLPSLHVQFGDFVNLFQKARVVLNYCEHGDLNFRVFETLGLARPLVTPRIENGQNELFEDGKHFLSFDPENLEECVGKIRCLLDDTELRETLAANGLNAIDSAHRAHHRAEKLTEILAAFEEKRTAVIERRLQEAEEIRQQFLRLLYLLWAREIQDESLQKKYLTFATGKDR